jgi:FtsH-binding integral membrane protein
MSNNDVFWTIALAVAFVIGVLALIGISRLQDASRLRQVLLPVAVVLTCLSGIIVLISALTSLAALPR